MTTLVYFSNAYPYEVVNNWERTELSLLRESFSEIFLATLRGNTGSVDPKLPEGIKLLPPIFDGPADGKQLDACRRTETKWKTRLEYLSQIPIWRWQVHCKVAMRCRSLQHANQFKGAFRQVERILQSTTFSSEIRNIADSAVCYFFWGTDFARVVPFLPEQIAKRCLVRFHGYDLFPERSNGFIPYQTEILNSAGKILSVSANGSERLKQLSPKASTRIGSLPLGTFNLENCKSGTDDVLRVVSCAYARPIKRLSLLAQAISSLQIPAEWTHIGDGPDMANIKRIMSTANAKVRFRNVGNVAPEEVPGIYQSQPFDVFVTTSAHEGLPVSIMEALSAGVPVIATSVGGIREIVDATVGRLLSANPTIDEIQDALLTHKAMSVGDTDRLRNNAKKRFQQAYDIERNTLKLADHLFSLAEQGSRG